MLCRYVAENQEARRAAVRWGRKRRTRRKIPDANPNQATTANRTGDSDIPPVSHACRPVEVRAMPAAAPIAHDHAVNGPATRPPQRRSARAAATQASVRTVMPPREAWVGSEAWHALVVKKTFQAPAIPPPPPSAPIPIPSWRPTPQQRPVRTRTRPPPGCPVNATPHAAPPPRSFQTARPPRGIPSGDPPARLRPREARRPVRRRTGSASWARRASWASWFAQVPAITRGAASKAGSRRRASSPIAAGRPPSRDVPGPSVGNTCASDRPRIHPNAPG